MTHNCFVCLNKSSNKICANCECYAHPACWGEYLKKSTDIYTIVYPTAVVMSTPLFTTCPQCRRGIGNIKPITRGDTEFARKTAVITTVRDKLFAAEMASSDNDKAKIFNDIFYLLSREKSLFRDDYTFVTMVKNKLKSLYTEQHWNAANLHHYTIFGEQIV